MKNRTKSRLLFSVISSVAVVFNFQSSASSKETVFTKIEASKNRTIEVDPKMNVPPLSFPIVEVEGHKNIFTDARKNKINKFKCTECHNNRPGKVQDRKGKLSHAGIKMKHGDSKAMNCFTCHNKGDRDRLVNITKGAVDFNQSHMVCANCHFQQKKDWVGGAHGKRWNYWAGKRVIKNCVSCHDPHKPQFPVRWPKTYSKELGR